MKKEDQCAFAQAFPGRVVQEVRVKPAPSSFTSTNYHNRSIVTFVYDLGLEMSFEVEGDPHWAVSALGEGVRVTMS